MVPAIGAQRIELVVRRAAGQAVDPDGGNGLGVEVVEGDGVQPGRRGALPACCGKFCRRNDGAAGLIQVLHKWIISHYYPPFHKQRSRA